MYDYILNFFRLIFLWKTKVTLGIFTLTKSSIGVWKLGYLRRGSMSNSFIDLIFKKSREIIMRPQDTRVETSFFRFSGVLFSRFSGLAGPDRNI